MAPKKTGTKKNVKSSNKPAAPDDQKPNPSLPDAHQGLDAGIHDENPAQARDKAESPKDTSTVKQLTGVLCSQQPEDAAQLASQALQIKDSCLKKVMAQLDPTAEDTSKVNSAADEEAENRGEQVFIGQQKPSDTNFDNLVQNPNHYPQPTVKPFSVGCDFARIPDEESKDYKSLLLKDADYRQILGVNFQKMVEARADRCAIKAFAAWVNLGSGEPGKGIPCLNFNKWADREIQWIEYKKPVLPWTFKRKNYMEYIACLSHAPNQVDPLLITTILDLVQDYPLFLELTKKRTASCKDFGKYCSEDHFLWSICSLCFRRGDVNLRLHSMESCVSNDNLTQIVAPRLRERFICPICLVLADCSIDLKCHLAFHHQRDLAFFGISKMHMLRVFKEHDRENILKIFPEFGHQPDELDQEVFNLEENKHKRFLIFEQLHNWGPAILPKPPILIEIKEDPEPKTEQIITTAKRITVDKTPKPDDLGDKWFFEDRKTTSFPQYSESAKYVMLATFKQQCVISYSPKLIGLIPGGMATVKNGVLLQQRFANGSRDFQHWLILKCHLTPQSLELDLNLVYDKCHAYIPTLGCWKLINGCHERKELTNMLTQIASAFVHSLEIGIINVMFWKPSFWFLSQSNTMVNYATHGFVEESNWDEYLMKRTYMMKKFTTQTQANRAHVRLDFCFQWFVLGFQIAWNLQLGHYPNMTDQTGLLEWQEDIDDISLWLLNACVCRQRSQQDKETLKNFFGMLQNDVHWEDVIMAFIAATKIAAPVIGEFQRSHFLDDGKTFHRCSTRKCGFFQAEPNENHFSAKESTNEYDEVQFSVIGYQKNVYKFLLPDFFQTEPRKEGCRGWLARNAIDKNGGPDVVRDIVSKKRGRVASKEPQGEKRKRSQ